ncbi:MAG: hypothetical protein KAU36_01815, partial [candidate division Zixibacteria bacterium]|nr:hypothetical protein [candidate division Zixibacteria bacterium]
QSRYNWLSTASLEGCPVFSAISDATGLERSFLISKLIFHSPNFKEDLADAVTSGDKLLTRARQVKLPSGFVRFINAQILNYRLSMLG